MRLVFSSIVNMFIIAMVSCVMCFMCFMCSCHLCSCLHVSCPILTEVNLCATVNNTWQLVQVFFLGFYRWLKCSWIVTDLEQDTASQKWGCCFVGGIGHACPCLGSWMRGMERPRRIKIEPNPQLTVSSYFTWSIHISSFPPCLVHLFFLFPADLSIYKHFPQSLSLGGLDRLKAVVFFQSHSRLVSLEGAAPSHSDQMV